MIWVTKEKSFVSLQGKKFNELRSALTHTASYSKGIECSSSRGKRSGNEADHTLPDITEIRNGWRHTSIDRYDFTVGKGTPLPLFKLPLEALKKIMKILKQTCRSFELDTLQTRKEFNQ